MEKEIDIKKLKERIGENLFKTRRSLNLTLTQASMLVEIKRSQLDWLERGRGCMNLNKLIHMSNFYDIDVRDLFR